MAAGPLVVAGPDTLLLPLDHPAADECRRFLARFAQLERSPGLVETYRLTDLGLWNAKAAGLGPQAVLDGIDRHAQSPVPHTMADRITEALDRFGPVTLEGSGDDLVLVTDAPELLDELLDDVELAGLVGERIAPTAVAIEGTARGRVKLALTRLRRPADDRAALRPGQSMEIALRPETGLRPYQRDAVDAWLPSGTGVIVLPCGAGKTLTALAALAEIGTTTLILTTGGTSLDQWERELNRFTTVEPDDVGRYGGGSREVRPLTLATYQMLATRRDGRYRNLELIEDHDWGLVIYDEVHLLPSAVFGLTAAIQARRRLGLTATLVREDGREGDVFTLIGPRRYNVPWADLELQGWIAPARCVEVRVVASDDERMAHAKATGQAKAKVAAGAAAKVDAVGTILARHPDEPTLVIGTYLDGLRAVADRHDLPW